MNKLSFRALAALMIVAMLLTACGGETEQIEAASGIAVQVEAVRSDTIFTENRVSGSVSSDNTATIMAPAVAECTAVYVQAGDMVTAGQKICTLDMESTLANYRAAKISYEAAQQSYDEQKAVLDGQVALQLTNLNIAEELLAMGAASQMEVDSARLQYNSAVATRNSSLSQMEAGVQQAKSGVEQLNMALDNMDKKGNVISPIDGVLASMTAVEGGFVSSSMPVAVINGLEQMNVTASVSEILVPKLAIGDVAQVHVAAANQTFEAIIRSVERSANMQTLLYTVVLTVPEGVEGLFSGMFADVTFHTDSSDNAIVVPTQAILTKNDTQYVFVVEEATAKLVEVETGLTGSGITEIVSGLSQGQQIVTVGQAYLADGDAVRVVAGEE